MQKLTELINHPNNPTKINRHSRYYQTLTPGFKRCGHCKKAKDYGCFAIDKATKDGYSSFCKRCRNEYQKDHPETRRLYQKLHPDKYIRRFKAWRDNDPARHWAAATLIHHRKRGFEVNISNQQLYNLISKIHFCQACGKPLNFRRGQHGPAHDSPTMDRMNNEKILSLSNILILCQSCNSSKGEKPYQEFIEAKSVDFVAQSAPLENSASLL